MPGRMAIVAFLRNLHQSYTVSAKFLLQNHNPHLVLTLPHPVLRAGIEVFVVVVLQRIFKSVSASVKFPLLNSSVPNRKAASCSILAVSGDWLPSF